MAGPARRRTHVPADVGSFLFAMLFALAVVCPPSARASLIFDSGGCDISYGGASNGYSGTCSTKTMGGGASGANILQLSGAATATNSGSIGDLGNLTFLSYGTATGTASDPLPLLWDFSVFDNDPSPTQGWFELTYYFDSYSYVRTESGVLNFAGGAGGSTVFISGSDAVSFAGPVSDYVIILTVSGFENALHGAITLTTPSGAIAVNTLAREVATPEPGSFPMLIAGLAVISFRLRGLTSRATPRN